MDNRLTEGGEVSPMRLPRCTPPPPTRKILGTHLEVLRHELCEFAVSLCPALISLPWQNWLQCPPLVLQPLVYSCSAGCSPCRLKLSCPFTQSRGAFGTRLTGGLRSFSYSYQAGLLPWNRPRLLISRHLQFTLCNHSVIKAVPAIGRRCL
jgi:hypothetical protein